MQRVKLKHIALRDLMLRLDEREAQVFALASSGVQGWGNTLCWSPDAVFAASSNSAENLEVFTKEQQEAGRLVIGYVSYDYGAQLHKVVLRAKDDLQTPIAFAASFSSWIRFNEQGATIMSADQEFIEYVEQVAEREPRSLPQELYETAFSPAQSRDSYNANYQKVKDYIVAGDVYQVNLAHRLEAVSAPSGRDLFVALHQNSRSDFQSYIEGADFEVLSFSPERFIKVEGKSITTSPIKGTRPRGSTKSEDMALKEDLRTNPKDTAELNMITDLLRNDIGSVCKVGSVGVAEERVITAYPTLWHAHSTIIGVLDDDVRPVHALLALMPGGSITGCPKKRAIEIIDELEDSRRGIYTGSIFVISPSGDLDSNIAIRTIIKKGDKLYLSVGGGIVSDSVEEDEYQESIDKAASFTKLQSSNLSSDILEQQFGPTDIEVLYQDDTVRIICTKTVADEQVLELSRVEFVQAGVDAYSDVHHEIMNGKSMGKAFRDHDIEFVREARSVRAQHLPEIFNSHFKTSGEATVVVVVIYVGVERIPYATILETYSPAVTWPNPAQGTGAIKESIEQFAAALSQLSTAQHRKHR